MVDPRPDEPLLSTIRSAARQGAAAASASAGGSDLGNFIGAATVRSGQARAIPRTPMIQSGMRAGKVLSLMGKGIALLGEAMISLLGKAISLLGKAT